MTYYAGGHRKEQMYSEKTSCVPKDYGGPQYILRKPTGVYATKQKFQSQ